MPHHNHGDALCGVDCPAWMPEGHVIQASAVNSVAAKANASRDVYNAVSDWWLELARQEVEKVVPKAVEYGATDLSEIGRVLGSVMGREGLSHEEATELGIYFYVVGKFARWTDAIKTGRRVSDDTLHDAGVYVRMAQRNRAVGGWPFPKEEETHNA